MSRYVQALRLIPASITLFSLSAVILAGLRLFSHSRSGTSANVLIASGHSITSIPVRSIRPFSYVTRTWYKLSLIACASFISLSVIVYVLVNSIIRIHDCLFDLFDSFTQMTPSGLNALISVGTSSSSISNQHSFINTGTGTRVPG